MVLGDFNAYISDNDREGPGDVLGPRCLHGETNNAGRSLLTLARLHGLPVHTTHNKAKNCHSMWKRGNMQSQLADILSNYPRVRTTDGAFQEGGEFQSDNSLVIGNLATPAELPFALQGAGNRQHGRQHNENRADN